MTYYTITSNGKLLTFAKKSNAAKFNVAITESDYASTPLTDNETERFLSYHKPTTKLTPAQKRVVTILEEPNTYLVGTLEADGTFHSHSTKPKMITLSEGQALSDIYYTTDHRVKYCPSYVTANCVLPLMELVTMITDTYAVFKLK